MKKIVGALPVAALLVSAGLLAGTQPAAGAERGGRDPGTSVGTQIGAAPADTTAPAAETPWGVDHVPVDLDPDAFAMPPFPAAGTQDAESDLDRIQWELPF